MSDDIPRIHVLGDSHSRYFLPLNRFPDRVYDPSNAKWKIWGKEIQGASVSGFRPQQSKLNVEQDVTAAAKTEKRLLLTFGQVDLELGYYYRLIVKKEPIKRDTYVVWLADIYQKFLETLLTEDCELAVKGVNMTVLAPKSFTARYVSRIVTDRQAMRPRFANRIVEPVLLSEHEQNEMHFMFNECVAKFCKTLGIGYFDLNDDLRSETDPLVISDAFRPSIFDHHLADSIQVRRLHYQAAGKIFALDTENVSA
ncbi:hypothetical protein [Celeribacter litoreus]|uniref:hypothetical protein n=1 Tax=Celeribacter litoreus TaxID=2876714 RepID=UPI001CCF8198|nr:hypothetical protein [Celeribacter litoreus]MCA0045043.1 hypothetical protein [Celeribacter litoreus]